jgi:hypothetical protein
MMARAQEPILAGDLLFELARERATELQRDAQRGRDYRRSATAAK